MYPTNIWSRIFVQDQYIGDIQVSIEDDVLHGKLLYISALVTYEGQSVDDVKASFEEAIDDYLKHARKKAISQKYPVD